MQKRRHHYGRYVFVFVLIACWIVGLIGLDGSRRPRLEMVAAAGAVVLIYKAVTSARRQRSELQPTFRSQTPTSVPRSCVVIHLGEAAR